MTVWDGILEELELMFCERWGACFKGARFKMDCAVAEQAQMQKDTMAKSIMMI